jgi:hypothetical protein
MKAAESMLGSGNTIMGDA